MDPERISLRRLRNAASIEYFYAIFNYEMVSRISLTWILKEFLWEGNEMQLPLSIFMQFSIMKWFLVSP